jgi:hypothetical protein
MAGKNKGGREAKSRNRTRTKNKRARLRPPGRCSTPSKGAPTRSSGSAIGHRTARNPGTQRSRLVPYSCGCGTRPKRTGCFYSNHDADLQTLHDQRVEPAPPLATPARPNSQVTSRCARARRRPARRAEDRGCPGPPGAPPPSAGPAGGGSSRPGTQRGRVRSVASSTTSSGDCAARLAVSQ